MMNRSEKNARKRVCLAALVILSIHSLTAEEAKKPRPAKFELDVSTIKTAERLLENEKDPAKRTLLLLRWVKLKEKIELEAARAQKSDAGQKAAEKVRTDILARLESELPSVDQPENQHLDQILRELGSRLINRGRVKEAWPYLKRIPAKTSDDYLNMGDSLLANSLIKPALDAYGEAAKDDRLKSVTAYKQGWAHLQMQDFEKAQSFFELAMVDNPNTPARLKEESYNERIHVLVHTFKKPVFSAEDAAELRQLAVRIKGGDGPQTEEFYRAGLKTLLNGFTATGRVELARNIFDIMQTFSSEANEVLLSSTPSWLKTYRGQLDHANLEKTLQSLPNTPIDSQKYSDLHAELNNTALFYEALIKDQPTPQLRAINNFVYQKYFELFPTDADSDDLRINYAKAQFEAGAFESCIQVAKIGSGKDPQLKKLLDEWILRCRLRRIDDEYKNATSSIFGSELKDLLLTSKAYAQNDLGFDSPSIFENLTRMLIGKIQQSPEASDWRLMLKELLQAYPMPKDQKLYQELLTISSELEFKDAMAASTVKTASKLEGISGDEERAAEFYRIFQTSPKDSEIQEKALRNSILLSSSTQALDRCEEYRKTYQKRGVLKPGDSVFDFCIQRAERNFQIPMELEFWHLAEAGLDADQKLRVGLLELALDQKAGENRLKLLKTEASQKVLSLWKEDTPEEELSLKPLSTLTAKTEKFEKALKPVKFEQIKKMLSAHLKTYNALEKEWVESASSLGKSQPALMGAIVEQRLLLTKALRDWIQKLPEPRGFSAEELQQYRTQIQTVLKTWDDRLQARVLECSQIAYSVSPKFSPKDPTLCPEQTPEATLDSYVAGWEKSRKEKPKADRSDKEALADSFLKEGKSNPNPLFARYFFLRALDLYEQDYDKAQAHLALAELTKRERFWRAALSLNGNLIEALKWQASRNVNSFFSRLYAKELEIAGGGGSH